MVRIKEAPFEVVFGPRTSLDELLWQLNEADQPATGFRQRIVIRAAHACAPVQGYPRRAC
jgi:hypothetical protein